MGNFGERLKDALEREKIVKTWEARIAATGKTQKKFCEDRGLDESQVCRWIKGTHGPEWDSIESVEKALKKEGV